MILQGLDAQCHRADRLGLSEHCSSSDKCLTAMKIPQALKLGSPNYDGALISIGAEILHFWDNMIPYPAESVHFFVLMNSTAK